MWKNKDGAIMRRPPRRVSIRRAVLVARLLRPPEDLLAPARQDELLERRQVLVEPVELLLQPRDVILLDAHLPRKGDLRAHLEEPEVPEGGA